MKVKASEKYQGLNAISKAAQKAHCSFLLTEKKHWYVPHIPRKAKIKVETLNTVDVARIIYWDTFSP